MSNHILQKIVDDIQFESLPIEWQNFNLRFFSKNKTLFDFQENALKNAIKALWLYYYDKKGIKEELFKTYKYNEPLVNFDNFNYNLNNKKESKILDLLTEYDKDYPSIGGKISFSHFINRMCFWMATGSGKTLVIIKLLEVLKNLMQSSKIPSNDILFLTYRDDLIDQFKSHIDEFNSDNNEFTIILKDLKEYENTKRESLNLLKNYELTIFYYRSDLLSYEHKEKIVDFRNYDNYGKWYIFLDEAHKGDKEDSIRQVIYSLLSRNGFLFNFSATFTDPRDDITCVYNYNLSKFVSEGYGKHIYLVSEDISAFKDKKDFTILEKQLIILKTLVLLTYINKFYLDISNIDKDLYHKPLLLTLVNSVNIEDSDLILFFKELEKIAKSPVNNNLLENAKKDIISKLEENSVFEFEEIKDIKLTIEKEKLLTITYKDILKHIYNSENPGAIEVLKIPNNKKELIFKLKTTNKPFALIKIGDISEWLKNKLSGYEIIERFENESIFSQINNDDSNINILMGSRSFYEGWDSNRPNLVVFINIGVGYEAKKFVLQSIGRGVRIEPIKNERKRLLELYNSKSVSEELFCKLKDLSIPLETLFVLGTSAKNIKDIVDTLKEQQQEKLIGQEFVLNKEVKDKLLLIPIYKESAFYIVEEETVEKLPINREDFELSKRLFYYLGEIITIMKFDCQPKILDMVDHSFSNEEKYYKFENTNPILNPYLTLDRIIKHFSVRSQKIDKFKVLEEEIVHFKRITMTNEEIRDGLIKSIKKVKSFDKKKDVIGQLKMDFEKHKDVNFFVKEVEKLIYEYPNEAKIDSLRVKYIPNHYYLPMVLSENEKIDYIKHIIKIPSETKFVNELEEYIQKPGNFFEKFDWWFFSKIDEQLDEIYIPWYDPEINNFGKFKPDFIFWLKKDNNYYIIFIDPKGTEHTEAYRKINSFKKIFEKDGIRKKFNYNDLNIKVILLLKPKDIAYALPEYRNYWFDSFNDLENKIFLKI